MAFRLRANSNEIQYAGWVRPQGLIWLTVRSQARPQCVDTQADMSHCWALLALNWVCLNALQTFLGGGIYYMK